MRGLTIIALAVLLPATAAWPQTTEGMITGRLTDADTGAGLARGFILWRNETTGEIRSQPAAPDGSFNLQRVSPGTYWIRFVICAAGVPPSERCATQFLPREAYDLELHVAGRLEIEVPMRQNQDVWDDRTHADAYVPGAGGDAVIHVYTADFASIQSEPLDVLLGRNGTLFSTLSYVVNPEDVRELPISGRDIYTMLVALPGVTADNATARGLGLSINGQRSSSSNFLLDGLENNDRLLTGPLTTLPPEAIEEYRVSTNNYSAEFGRTGGFVANAITRGGDNAWHGVLYADANDTVLNANSYQHKYGLNTSTGQFGPVLPRQPQTEIEPGFWVGGPIEKNRLFLSGAYDRLRSRSEGDPFPYEVPVLSRFQFCFPNSKGTALLERFRPPVPAGTTLNPSDCADLTTTFSSGMPLEFDRHTALGRADLILTDKQRLMGRVAISRFDQPDFIYSLYPGFSSTLDVNSTNLSLAHLWTIRPRVTSELRAGVRDETQGWDRPGQGMASLQIQTGEYPFAMSAPGSDAAYAFHYGATSGEVSEVLQVARGRQVWTFGGGVLINRSNSLLTYRQDGLYQFGSPQAFGADDPTVLQISLNRLQPSLAQPDYARDYSNQQYYGFAQTSLKLTRSLGVDAGIRYEYFGNVRNTGPLDPYFLPGAGTNIIERISGAQLLPGDRAHADLYKPDRNNWAPRVGIFHDLSGNWRTVWRAAFGLFYDRPFENLTMSSRNNSMELFDIRSPAGYPNPQAALVAGIVPQPDGVPGALWIDPNLRTPYVQSWFTGVQHQFSRTLYGEVSAQGALARKLISTDLVNRPSAGSGSPYGHLNAEIPEDFYYRTNAASSSYSALTALARYSGTRVLFQAAYTWSHSIDNQSDPLQGTFDDLGIIRSTNVNLGSNTASFMEELNSRLDRGSSDFDQRQNLVFFSLWRVGARPGTGRLKRLMEDWQVGEMAGFRSGFPYNLISGSDGLQSCAPVAAALPATPELEHPRPTLLPGAQPVYANPRPVPGGFQIVNPAAFCDPGVGVPGTLGRNSLIGPGFWNVDLTVMRMFRKRGWSEERGFEVRADWFNAFNHGNLGDPNGVADSPTFGEALIGRQGVQPSFPSAAPLDQLAREIHLQLKFVF